MASQANEASALIAAVPPQTDYMTYLTLLEYQLTSANLPTLTKLLTDDDGALAIGIGWDLVKLVLPLSEDVPEEARQCLEVVARRGNPREVVVSVNEELERLIQDHDGANSDPDQEFERDGGEQEFRTFAGEAEPIHLGTMTLEGMPLPSAQGPGEAILDPNEDRRAQHADSYEATSTKFKILLSMLSILHPRIQVKHPSRFLATSLPTALRSYRQLPIDFATTAAFLALLGKLSGRQSPALPPRASPAAVGEISPNAAPKADTKPASLPDPEAQSEAASSNALSADETAIIKRLLQAVLLEVLEEYVVSLTEHEPPFMSWTARLREVHGPEKIVPGRQTETEKWTTDPALLERDTLMVKFVDLSNDLGLDLRDLCKHTLHPETASTEAAVGEAVAEDAESPSEYPTSAEQIPLPRIGAFLLCIAHCVVPALAAPQTAGNATFLHGTFLDSTYFLKGIEDPRNHPTFGDLPTPVLDSLIAILYTAARADDIVEPSAILLFLTSLCSDNPDPYIRDSAHATATIIFHHSPPEIKLQVVKQILRRSQNPNLRAVAVHWLKDDIAKKGTSGLHPDILTTDAEVGDALCVLPRVNDLVVQLPFRVAVLNLLTIAPTEQGSWLIDALRRHRGNFSDQEAQQNDITAFDLWSFDDALERAQKAWEKRDPASCPTWTRKEEWLKAA